MVFHVYLFICLIIVSPGKALKRYSGFEKKKLGLNNVSGIAINISSKTLVAFFLTRWIYTKEKVYVISKLKGDEKWFLNSLSP